MAEIDKDRVIQLFAAGYNCAQCVFLSVLERKGIAVEYAGGITAGFGMGMTNGATCGAVSGAIMAIGLLEKFQHEQVAEHKEATYAAVRTFLARFEGEFGSTRCQDLTGGHTWQDPAERQEARDAGVFQEVCPPLVATAVNIVLNMYPD
ncbi:MAG TPA: C-GCAxxG-C-C family protein [Candidatus Lokiarchaeia archaeon]|nr:C-GCAxxG-C-C family protein [Candidatus Lokiarchaeia archaeon]